MAGLDLADSKGQSCLLGHHWHDGRSCAGISGSGEQRFRSRVFDRRPATGATGVPDLPGGDFTGRISHSAYLDRSRAVREGDETAK